MYKQHSHTMREIWPNDRFSVRCIDKTNLVINSNRVYSVGLSTYIWYVAVKRSERNKNLFVWRWMEHGGDCETDVVHHEITSTSVNAMPNSRHPAGAIEPPCMSLDACLIGLRCSHRWTIDCTTRYVTLSRMHVPMWSTELASSSATSHPQLGLCG